jgi:hypothetical protein
MPRKRTPGGGRKPADKAGPKTETILARVHPDLKRRIELTAQAADVSMSREIESLLELGLKARDDSRRDNPIRAICFLIAETANACRAFTDPKGKPLFEVTDPFVFRAFKLAVAQLLDWLEPKDEIVSIVDRVGEDTFRGDPPAIVDSYRTPEARAQAAVQFIWSRMQTPPSADDLEFARNWRPFGARLERLYYGMSDVRRHLRSLMEKGEQR